MNKKLLNFCLIFSFATSLVGQVQIPSQYYNPKFLRINSINEVYSYGSPSHSDVNSNNAINIPISAIDTAGSIDASDSINYYIHIAQEKASKSHTGFCYLLLPSGKILIEKPILLLSNVYVKGESAGETHVLCKVGEGKHCFVLSPTSAGKSTSKFKVLRHAKPFLKGQRFIEMPKNEIDLFYSSGDTSFLSAMVYLDDSSLINNTWAKGTIKEQFWLNRNVNNTSGANYKIEFSNLSHRQPDWPYWQLYNNQDRTPTLNYDTAGKSEIHLYHSIINSGIMCLSINRLDTTTSQTSNILLQNASHCYIKGVESDGCNFGHITLNNSFMNTIKRNHLFNGNGYGGGGRAYGVTLQQGSSCNSVVDNILHHLRHSILLQSGANNNVVLANYSYDPYWEGVSLPSDAAGDIVLHGNYPFGNLFELNVAQQIVIDDSHGKNGPFNIFHRNWLQNYGITMSAENGSDSQVFTGNEVTNTGFIKGLYILQDNGHFTYGNQVRGNISPASTLNQLVGSISHINYNGEYIRRTGWISAVTVINIDSIPFGEPFNQNNKTIMAMSYKGKLPVCFDYYSDNVQFAAIKHHERKQSNFIYPNPSNGLINSNTSGLLTVYDASGRKVFEQTIVANQEFKIPIKGFFIAHLKTEKGVFTQKVIIQ